MNPRLKRPRESFSDYLIRISEQDFYRDLAWISSLAHEATKQDSPLRESRRVFWKKKLIKKLHDRLLEKKSFGVHRRWDERNYRPLRKLEKELGHD